jgi:hypothetical protein
VTVLSFRKKKADPSKEEFDKFVKSTQWHAQVMAKALDNPAILIDWYLQYLSWQAQGRPFAVPNGWLEERGVSRKVKARILGKLEVKGVIVVHRQSGRSPRIEIIGL